MGTFNNGDKVKIPTIGTASIKTSEEELAFDLKDYTLNYLIVDKVWEEEKEYGVKRADNGHLINDLYHERDLEHYEEYNETFNPEAHSSLIIDFDAVETIEEAALKLVPKSLACFQGIEFDANQAERDMFIRGAKSEAAKNYWYQQFIKEQEDSIKVSDIRNKLNPIVNLITMLENGLINATVDVHSIVQSELKQCKISIEYLTKNEK